MKVKPKQNGTKVVTGKVRLSYANLFEPRAGGGQNLSTCFYHYP